MAKVTVLLVAAVGACLVPGIVASQPGTPVLAAPQHFLYETEQRREAIEQEMRQRKLLPEPAQPVPAPPPAPAIEQRAPDAPCWYLSGVSLAGNSLIPTRQLQQAVQPHLSPCLTPGQIDRLLAVTQA